MNEGELQARLTAAGQAQRAGQRDHAAALYRSVLAERDHPLAFNALGVMALGDGDTAGAADMFRRAIAVDSRSPELWMNLARAHRMRGDDDAERAALEGALAIDQRHFLAVVRLAELFERTGQPASAAERWGGVLAMAPLVEPRTPALEALEAHARAFVERQQEAFAAAVDAGLAGVRDGVERSARRRFDACVDHLAGRRQIYANVCHGLHFPFLPADEFFDRGHFPWMAGIEAQTDVIRAELQALLEQDAEGFSPYVSMEPGTPENKWSPLDRRRDWSALHLWRNGVRDDVACARAPRTAAAIEALPLARIAGRAPTVFFSILEPGTHLPPHTGVTNVRAIVHLPLIVPDGCTFRVGGETRMWREGEAFAFDDTIEHEAWNRSSTVRAILIFDVWNPHLTEEERRMLQAFYPVADQAGYDLRRREI